MTYYVSLREFLDITSILRSIKQESLGIPRRSMPQIASDKTQDFLKFLKSKNISNKNQKVNPLDYRASQKEFNDKKVISMYEQGITEKLKSKPVLVSKDNYIIDGHHRWIALYIHNTTNKSSRGDVKMNAIVINKNARELIDIIKTYDSVGFKKLNEGLSHVNETEWCTS